MYFKRGENEMNVNLNGKGLEFPKDVTERAKQIAPGWQPNEKAIKIFDKDGDGKLSDAERIEAMQLTLSVGLSQDLPLDKINPDNFYGDALTLRNKMEMPKE